MRIQGFHQWECTYSHRHRRKEAQRMAKVIATVFAVIVFLLFCVLIATGLVWGILTIVKEVIELWRKIKE
jgi:hypothetical protein